MDQARKEGPRGEDDGIRMEDEPDLRHDALDPVAPQEQVVDGLLEQGEVGLILEPPSDRAPVENPVRLGARGADGGSLAGIEDPELDTGLVGGQRHRPPESVHLLHQVPLADPTDGGVARHLAERFDAVGEQERARTRAGGGERSLGTGVTATDHDDVEALGELHDGEPLTKRRYSRPRGRVRQPVSRETPRGPASGGTSFHVKHRRATGA